MSELRERDVNNEVKNILFDKPEKSPRGFKWRRGVQGNGKRINNQNYFCCREEFSNNTDPYCVIVLVPKCMVSSGVLNKRVSIEYKIKLRSNIKDRQGEYIVREEYVKCLTIERVENMDEVISEINNKKSSIKNSVHVYIDDMVEESNAELNKIQ